MVDMACLELVQAMQQSTSGMLRRVRIIHAILRNVRRMGHGAHLKSLQFRKKTYGQLMEGVVSPTPPL